MGCQCSFALKNDLKDELLTDPLLLLLKEHFAEYEVLLYTISDCAASSGAKSLLKAHALSFEYFDLDLLNDHGELHNKLRVITAQSSTPYVFLRGKYLGGLEELRTSLPTLRAPS